MLSSLLLFATLLPALGASKSDLGEELRHLAGGRLRLRGLRSNASQAIVTRHNRFHHNRYEGQGKINVWPVPNSVESGSASATLSPAVKFTGDISDEHVATSILRYKELMFPHECESCASGANIQRISVSLVGEGSDESYVLQATPDLIEISAAKPVGVQYALETLSQLVSFNFDKMQYETQAALPLTVRDEPRFSHRGLLVDSSRHFLPVTLLKRVIDSMSYAKLNRLHWHVTDAQSFPINSRVDPELAEKGAWSQRERYTPEDVKSVVNYADLRGIVVVPEFDMPGHTKSWGAARPELMSFTDDRFSDGNSAALDPTNPRTYELVDSVLQDWMVGREGKPAFFQSPYVHLGTDEVPFNAWKTKGYPVGLFRDFVSHAFKSAKGLGKEVVMWEEAFKDGPPPPESIIQVWLDGSIARRAAEGGYRVILSEGWYLDHLDKTAEFMYNRNPSDYVDSDKTSNLIGGEGCMWGETVDGGDMEQTIWPRLGAVAERLWSPPGEHWSRAKPRLAAFRCLLLERGIPAGTLEGHGRSTPPGPGSCGSQ
mmetsp:Transcript_29413/g.51568  ORF Transcript_29413/g.51568 Transcript_29413/m.51568 type:complete len:543 (+) Transcript_29413:86-1714(+)